MYAPAFDRHREEPVAGAIAVEHTVELVITEGNYLLMDERPWDRVRLLLDDAWFLTTDDARRRERLVRRHVAHGRSPEDAARWVDDTDQPNARRVEGGGVRADLVWYVE